MNCARLDQPLNREPEQLQESKIARRDAARFNGLKLMENEGCSCWNISSVGAVDDRPSFHPPRPATAASGRSHRRGDERSSCTSTNGAHSGRPKATYSYTQILLFVDHFQDRNDNSASGGREFHPNSFVIPNGFANPHPDPLPTGEGETTRFLSQSLMLAVTINVLRRHYERRNVVCSVLVRACSGRN